MRRTVAAWNRKKITKNPYFGVQGRLRSSTLVPPENSSAVLVMLVTQQACVYLSATILMLD